MTNRPVWETTLRDQWAGYRQAMSDEQRAEFDRMLASQDRRARAYGLMLAIKCGLRNGGHIVIDHRGEFSAEKIAEGRVTQTGIPENTSDALKRSWSHGFMAELDVQMTKDKHVIGFHDPKVGRALYDPTDPDRIFAPQDPHRYRNELDITDRPDLGNVPIDQVNLDEVKKLALRGPDGFPSSYRVETLEEILKELHDDGVCMPLTLDIKNPAAAKAAWDVIKTLKDPNGMPLSATVALKLNADQLPSPQKVKDIFGESDWQKINLMIIYGSNHYNSEVLKTKGIEEDAAHQIVLNSAREHVNQPYCCGIEIVRKSPESRLNKLEEALHNEFPWLSVGNFQQGAEVGSAAPSMFFAHERPPSSWPGGEDDLNETIKGLPKGLGEYAGKGDVKGQNKVVHGEGKIVDVGQFLANDPRQMDIRDVRFDPAMHANDQVTTTDDPKALKKFLNGIGKWNDQLGLEDADFDRLRAVCKIGQRRSQSVPDDTAGKPPQRPNSPPRPKELGRSDTNEQKRHRKLGS